MCDLKPKAVTAAGLRRKVDEGPQRRLSNDKIGALACQARDLHRIQHRVNRRVVVLQCG
jgi:hypothetical protein